jgi:LacI family transcriptional regulator
VGFDGIKHGTITNPALTSVSVDTARWGGIIARMLAKRRGQPDAPPDRVVVDPRLVVRESSLNRARQGSSPA